MLSLGIMLQLKGSLLKQNKGINNHNKLKTY